MNKLGYGEKLALSVAVIILVAAVGLAILSLSGCRLEPADTATERTAAERAAWRDSLRAELREQSSRAKYPNLWKRKDAAHAAATGNISESPNSSAMTEAERDSLRRMGAAVVDDWVMAGSAAKVAAVMADNDITLPQVAAWLSQYGFDVVSRANTLRPHWSPAPPGRDAQGNIVPVAYYVANVRIAVGDTTLVLYAPQAVGPVWMRVKAYDGRGMSGIWSVTEVSGSGALLPGVAE